MTEQWSYVRPDEKEADVDRSWPTQEEAEQDLALDISYARRMGRNEEVRSWTRKDYKLIKRQVSDWEVVE